MRILFSELPDSIEIGQVLCYTRPNVPMTLLEEILVPAEEQAKLIWPDLGHEGWVTEPEYREGPIQISTPIGRHIALWGIARKPQEAQDPEKEDVQP